ncbi:MAG: hypothetical protein K8I82_28215, partial [Anaerolineae bacterium]|nr:hypothetical protein [Anaerolineae bacterium]
HRNQPCAFVKTWARNRVFITFHQRDWRNDYYSPFAQTQLIPLLVILVTGPCIGLVLKTYIRLTD